ncbi:MAG: hypothetical protein KAR35_10205, partial [Candidatus Heimdallarchaeota archaeon]|nr:hypothetical protein [Candidatus Heimdallarchaeota archaeon]MCK5049728.1 hypothetical protein [Candidatus Heimdallarchaeota archaeon]
MSMSSKKGSINNSLSDDHLCYSVSNKNHRTDSDLYISQNNKKWEVIKTVQLGSVLPSSYSDIDGDMLPEIVVSYDAFGGRQERGEVGYTKILELDPSSGLFTTELLSIETQEPVHLHPIQPFNNGTSYFLLNGLKSYDFHDYYYLVSYNDG